MSFENFIVKKWKENDDNSRIGIIITNSNDNEKFIDLLSRHNFRWASGDRYDDECCNTYIANEHHLSCSKDNYIIYYSNRTRNGIIKTEIDSYKDLYKDLYEFNGLSRYNKVSRIIKR